MRKFVFMFLIIVLLLAVAPVSAQDVPTTPPTQGELEAALLALVKLVSDLTFVPGAAALVVALTAIAKRILPASISAGAIAITLQVIVWVIYIVAKHYGYADQFDSYIAVVTTVVSALGGLLVSSYAAEWGYKKLSARDVPVLGAARPPTPQG